MRRFIMLAIVLGLVMVFTQNSISATVTGNAYLDAQSDHSGISVVMSLISPPPIPATGAAGLVLILISMSVLLFHKRRRHLVISMIVTGLAGLGCVAYAFSEYSGTTDLSGAYSLLNVEPGEYTLTASKADYIPETRSNVVIAEGTNLIPDIILYPMATPTPVPTSTPTSPPTIILVDFGIDTHETGSPDANNNNWNNLSTDSVQPPSGTLTNLITTAGDPSGIQLSVSGFGNGANANGTTVPDEAALGSLGIVSATRDSFYVISGSGTVTLSGLAPNRYYRLECFGSRDVPDSRVTRYTATGLNSASATLETSGAGIGQAPEADANRSGLAVLDEVQPTAAGVITLAASIESGSFAYLNAVRITELDEVSGPNQPPEATSVIIVGASAVGRSITVHYDYTDAEGDPEGATVMEWQFDSPPFSSPATLVTGTDSTVQIPDEEGLYVRVGVTPYAVSGAITGTTAYSEWLGPIASSTATTVFHIGNSFTRWGHIPLQLQNLAEDAGNTHVYGEQLTDGQGLGYHWANGLQDGVWTRGTPSRLELETGSWDWLVLQPMSREWQPDRIDSFIDHALLFTALAASNNTQVVLYQYWNYLDEGTAVQDEINAAFETVRAELATNGYNVLIVPAGDAFASAVDDILTLSKADLYQDNYHPGDVGYYLSALVHYGVVYGQSPAGLTNIGVSSDSGNDDPVVIDLALASALQDVAWDTVLNHPYSGVMKSRLMMMAP